jgi:hypothetical protein
VSAGTLREQQQAFAALDALAIAWPDLPAPYVTVHGHTPQQVGLQLDSPQEFEAWRSALGANPQDVVAHCRSRDAWLSVETRAHGVAVRLTGFGLGLTAEQVVPQAEAVAARMAGLLAEQRHQVEDPAEPPLPPALAAEVSGPDVPVPCEVTEAAHLEVGVSQLQTLLAPSGGDPS